MHEFFYINYKVESYTPLQMTVDKPHFHSKITDEIGFLIFLVASTLVVVLSQSN